MLTKFETKSNRVKGLAFHPKRFATVRLRRVVRCFACSLSLMLGVCAGPGSWRLCTVAQFRYAIKAVANSCLLLCVQ